MKLTAKQTAALKAIAAGEHAGTPLRQSNSTSATTVYWQQCQALEAAGLLEPINGFLALFHAGRTGSCGAADCHPPEEAA